MSLPFPRTIAALLEAVRDPACYDGNLSLFFDKGAVRYAGDGSIERKKDDLLNEFAAIYKNRKDGDFEERRERRLKVFECLGVEVVPFTTRSRLAVGLGLPHPIDTGFLFDRLTGCPYLPGSSVKGLLRAAARLVLQEELTGNRDFWSDHLGRIFGPEIEPKAVPKTGEAILYDAFPARWPELDVDVLTPHYGDYYKAGSVLPPADWYNPVPVAFLTVAPNVTFEFPIAAAETDREELKALLGTALDWLGVGAKKSAGYGVMGKGPVSVASAPASVSAAATKREEPQPPPGSAQEKKGTSLWNGVELQLRQGSTFIVRSGKQILFSDRDLPDEVYRALKAHRRLRADVEVQKVPSGYRIMAVKSWKKV